MSRPPCDRWPGGQLVVMGLKPIENDQVWVNWLGPPAWLLPPFTKFLVPFPSSFCPLSFLFYHLRCLLELFEMVLNTGNVSCRHFASLYSQLHKQCWFQALYCMPVSMCVVILFVEYVLSSLHQCKVFSQHWPLYFPFFPFNKNVLHDKGTRDWQEWSWAFFFYLAFQPSNIFLITGGPGLSWKDRGSPRQRWIWSLCGKCLQALLYLYICLPSDHFKIHPRSIREFDSILLPGTPGYEAFLEL